MGDPRGGVDLPGLHRGDDPMKVLRARVSRGEERDLLAVEVGIVKAHVADEQANEDELAATRNKLEAACHRRRVTGHIEDCRRQLAVVKLEETFERILAVTRRVGADRLLDAELLSTEVQSILIEIEDRDVGSGDLRELHDREPDRPDANHENLLAGLERRSVESVRTDAESLDERQMFGRKSLGTMQLVHRDSNRLAHASVDMHAEDLKADAAVRLVASTGDALSAVQVGLDGAKISDADAAFLRRATGRVTESDDFHAQLVPENPRVAEEGLAAPGTREGPFRRFRPGRRARGLRLPRGSSVRRSRSGAGVRVHRV